MTAFDPSFLALGVLAFLVAGAVKGLAGIGLPTSAIALLTLSVSPRVAIATLMLPMIVTNAWQVWRAGDVKGALWRYRWFIAVSSLGVWAVAILAAEVSDRILFLSSGIVILVFVLLNLSFEVPQLPRRYDTMAQIGLGAIAGLLGGLTSLWAAPIVIYLMGKHTPKDEFVRATGLMIALASIPLGIGYVQIGALTDDLAVVSAMMILPAIAGFSVGELLRSYLDQAAFRKAVLLVFLVLGLNLIRRAVMG